MDQNLLAPASTNHPRVSVGIRLIALLLMVGGAAGVVLFVMLVIQMAPKQPLMGLFSLPGACVFVWSALTGFDLWRGKPAGYRWARILFAAQIPIILIPGFQYWFYTGVSGYMMFSEGRDSNTSWSFNLGSSVSMLVGGQSSGRSVGINLLAVVIFLFLLMSESAKRATRWGSN